MHLILFAYNNLFITKTKSCSLTKVCCIKNSVVIEPLKVTGGLTHRIFKVVTDNGKYIVKLLNPNIMKRPTAMGNFNRTDNFEEILKENNKNSNRLIDVSNVWGEIKLHLLDYNISQISYDIWFEPIVDVKQNNTEFIIYSEDEIVVRHINEYYKDILIKAIQTHYLQDIKEVKIEQIVKQLSQ